eukprot:2824862-Amphidinium_carterae.1
MSRTGFFSPTRLERKRVLLLEGRFYYIRTSTGYVKVLLLERKKFLLHHDLNWTYQRRLAWNF